MESNNNNNYGYNMPDQSHDQTDKGNNDMVEEFK